MYRAFLQLKHFLTLSGFAFLAIFLSLMYILHSRDYHILKLAFSTYMCDPYWSFLAKCGRRNTNRPTL